MHFHDMEPLNSQIGIKAVNQIIQNHFNNFYLCNLNQFLVFISRIFRKLEHK